MPGGAVSGVGDSLRRELSDSLSRIAGAHQERDLRVFEELFTTDAVLFNPDGTSAQGRAAIVDSIRQWWDEQRILGVSFNVLEVVQCAFNYAWDVSEYTVVAEAVRSGQRTIERGRHLVVWRRVGGRWLIARDLPQIVTVK